MSNLFGTGINQIPTNGMLGNLAFQDKSYVSVDAIGIGTTFVDSGTVGQPLQVSGGAYVSGNLGIGTTNPTSKLWVNGDGKFTGVVTAIGFSGNASLTQLNVTGVSTLGITSATNLTSQTLNVSGVTTLGITTTTNLTAQQLNISGITTVGFLTATNISVSGVTTSNSYYIGTTQVVSSARQLQNIASLDATTTATIETAIQQAPNDFTSLNISGISTLQSTTLIGGGTSTGTTGQILQVAGISSSAYIGGNLGIGNTNPSVKLQVSGGDVTIDRGSVDSNLTRTLTVGGARASAGVFFASINLSNYDRNNGAVDYNAVKLVAQQPAGAINGGLLAIYTTPNNSTTAVERVRVFDTGEVGINTTVVTGTANQTLQVNSGAYVSDSVGIGTTNPKVKLDISGDIRVSSGSTFVFGTGLGIGATAPGYIYALSNPFTSVQIGGTAGRSGNALVDIRASNYPDGTNVLNVQTTSETYTGTIGTYKPYTPAGTVIEIGNTKASQRVGIGSTLFGRSAALISIYAYNNDNVTNAFFGAVAGDVQNGPSNFVFGRRTGAYSWEETVRIDTSGNLGIGTTNPTSKLHVVGDTYISGILTATDINSASDIRLKTNIKPFENTLEKIVQINGVSFNWIDSNAKSGGIIAQDVEKVFPELVNDGDHKTVNYNGLIGVLIESIKELKQEVEDLKLRLNET